GDFGPRARRERPEVKAPPGDGEDPLEPPGHPAVERDLDRRGVDAGEPGPRRLFRRPAQLVAPGGVGPGQTAVVARNPRAGERETALGGDDESREQALAPCGVGPGRAGPEPGPPLRLELEGPDPRCVGDDDEPG